MTDRDRTMVNAPSPWVVRFAPLVAGEVLDIACGAGRHARFFLARGNRVTALDRDVSGLADIAGQAGLTIHQIDLEAQPAGAALLPGGPYGGVVVTNYLWRPLLPAIVTAVAEGGVLIYETFAAGNAAYGKPSNPDFLLQPGELLAAVRGALEVIAYEHGTVERPRPAVVQRLCAVRGAAQAAPLD